ncbi:MAG: hypothetical protein GMKNLPBB_03354 [Myxococcota bacterium]|nr:hypothetical protein [Myxococcota bacterium]
MKLFVPFFSRPAQGAVAGGAALAVFALVSLAEGQEGQPHQPASPGPATGTIRVEIRGFKNDAGKARVALFRSKEGFPGKKEAVFRGADPFIRNGQALVEYADIPVGAYAIAVFHDENMNEDLDTNWLGIPAEGYGFSNNARGHFGPPGFDKAKIVLKAPRLDTRIDVDY